MKKALISLVLFCLLALAMPKIALGAGFAEEMGRQLGAAGTGAGYDAPTDPRETAANIIRIALGFLGMIFLVLTIYAGFLWMTASGNDEKATKAKSLLYQAVIGLIIILAAYSITWAVVQLARGKDINPDRQYYIEEPLPVPCTGGSCP